jgi:hypothetical protein
MNHRGLKISLLPTATRRMNGVKTVSSGAVNRTIPQAEYVESCRKYQQEAATHVGSLPGVVNGLWKVEGLSTTFGKYRLPDNTLNDPRLPREALGIAHVGYGAASTEHVLFDARKLQDIAATKCEPNYRNFTLEGIGSILRIYEPGFFKFMCGMMGLIPRGAPPGPVRDGFFAGFLSAFSPEVQRLITHGYGRIVAFSRTSIYKALEEAMELPPERVEPCVQGIAFAFAMMNAEEMPRLMENSDIPHPPPARAAFQNGLVYAMVFCDWFAPGLLAAWQPQGRLEEKLIALARAESAANLQRGYPLPFRLETPVTA